ncbi:uncharacterized protein VTP21DRAFT_10744 [Calcarisporiella thermophila]|uniref:uncharacterized protein n=1 Tax=Calcarisporiella thermophila TaxID=911321 RepID=UPI00374282EE
MSSSLAEELDTLPDPLLSSSPKSPRAFSSRARTRSITPSVSAPNTPPFPASRLTRHRYDAEAVAGAWQSTRKSQRWKDFILVAEFSEIEGPVPVLTIPEGAVNLGRQSTSNGAGEPKTEEGSKESIAESVDQFDVNAFVLRIVSVNHDNQGLGEAFRIPEDTQVYVVDSECNFYAYVHHFILFDIYARGFVRPICMSYITQDPNKILSFFQDFVNYFSEVSEIFKNGNYVTFYEELQRRLLDLRYTRRILVEEEAAEYHEPEELDEPTTSKLEEEDPLESLRMPPLQAHDTDADTITSTCSSTRPVTIETVDAAIDLTRQIMNALDHRSSSVVDHYTSDTSKQTADDPANAMTARSMTSTLSPPTPQDIASLKEILRRTLSRRSQETLIGQEAYEMNEDVELEEKFKDYKPQFLETIYPVNRYDGYLRPLEKLCTGGEYANEHRSDEAQMPQWYDRALHKLQLILSRMGRESFVLRQEKEDAKLASPLSSAVSFGRCFLMNFKNPMPRKLGTQTPFYQYPSEVNSLGEEAILNAMLDEGVSVPDDGEDFKLPHHPSANISKLPSESSTAASIYLEDYPYSSLPYPSSAIAGWADGDSPHPPPSSVLPPVSPRMNIDSCLFPLKSVADIIWSDSADKLGSGILELLKSLKGDAQHLIFALLSGRPLIVIGSEENKARVSAAIVALAVFVPGHSKYNHRIIKWYKKEMLSPEEMEHIKLVGVDKNLVDSMVYEANVSVLDVDSNKLLSGPLYISGKIIHDILSPLSSFEDDSSFIAHIFSVFSDISLKAFVYYHVHLHPDTVAEFKPDPTAFAEYRRVPSSSSSHNIPPPPPLDFVPGSSYGSESSKKWGGFFDYLAAKARRRSSRASSTASIAASVAEGFISGAWDLARNEDISNKTDDEEKSVDCGDGERKAKVSNFLGLGRMFQSGTGSWERGRPPALPASWSMRSISGSSTPMTGDPLSASCGKDEEAKKDAEETEEGGAREVEGEGQGSEERPCETEEKAESAEGKAKAEGAEIIPERVAAAHNEVEGMAKETEDSAEMKERGVAEHASKEIGEEGGKDDSPEVVMDKVAEGEAERHDDHSKSTAVVQAGLEETQSSSLSLEAAQRPSISTASAPHDEDAPLLSVSRRGSLAPTITSVLSDDDPSSEAPDSVIMTADGEEESHRGRRLSEDGESSYDLVGDVDEGQRFLEEELLCIGDDQAIIMYIASNVDSAIASAG